MSTVRQRTEPPGWRGRPLEELPWAVVIRVAVCWGVVCMILTLLAAAFLPRPFGFVGTTIVSGSMMPNIQPGDVALVQELPEYGLGQVILFPSPADPEQQVMHRIVDIRADGMLVTKGDANELRDSTPVDPDSVIGVGRVLVPAIGLPIVWAVHGYVLLVVLTIALTALLVRGLLRIEFFPSTRKRDASRAVIEGVAVVAMLAVASFVIVAGVARSASADFVERTQASGSWTMAEATPPPEGTCTITNYRYETFDGGSEGFMKFDLANHTSQTVAAGWTLTWNFAGDEVAVPSEHTPVITQDGRAVEAQGADWLTVPPNATSYVQIGVTSPTQTYLDPKDFFLNGAPCAFVPLPPVEPTPTPTTTPTPPVDPPHVPIGQCTVTSWRYTAEGSEMRANFSVKNQTGGAVANWRLRWTFVDDQQVTRTESQDSFVNDPPHATFISGGLPISPNTTAVDRLWVSIPSGIYQIPEDFYLNDMPCTGPND